MRNRVSKAAYFLVDLSIFPEEARALIMEDAVNGGREFGIRVVEEVHSGPAITAIYGVYYKTDMMDDEALYEAAKAEFGVVAEDEDVEESARAAAEEEAARVAAEAEATEQDALRRAGVKDDTKAPASKLAAK